MKPKLKKHLKLVAFLVFLGAFLCTLFLLKIYLNLNYGNLKTEIVPTCLDADKDGYDNCVTGGDNKPLDCNDNNANINPGKTEVCDNSIDDDCDGAVDENCAVSTTRKGILFYDDAEDAPNLTSDWGKVGDIAPNTFGVSTERVRAGRSSYKYLLAPYEVAPDNRVELILRKATTPPINNFSFGTEYWMAWSVFIPENFVFPGAVAGDWGTLGQFHGATESCDTKVTNPNVAFFANHPTGGFRVTIRGITDKCYISSSTLARATAYTTPPLKKNAWNDIVLNFKFDWQTSSSPFFKMWQNGQLVVNDTGINAFNDAKPPYFKWGIYAHQPEYLTFYYDEFRVGNATSDYSSVAPGSSLPPPACVDADKDLYDACAPGTSGDDGKEIDCDDNEYWANPGLNYDNCDSVDNDCDGTKDNDCDKDKDGYCDSSLTMYRNNLMCPKTPYLANKQYGDDCNDNNANINPAKTEICGNDIDEDCSGTDTTCLLSADFNSDNKVDIFDFSILLANLGITNDCQNQADADGDCKVGIFDFNILIEEFGNGV